MTTKKQNWKLFQHKDTGEFTLLQYAWQQTEDFKKDLVELPNTYTFEAALYYAGYYRGQSACGMNFTDMTTGLKHEMCMTDFDALMKSGKLQGRTVIGKWGFVKRGTTLGIKYIAGENNETN